MPQPQVCEGCGGPGKMSCPTCLKLGVTTAFCGQECFKTNWGKHKLTHKTIKEKIKYQEEVRKFRPPKFNYTGVLRPWYVTPMRSIPPRIEGPDWQYSGFPAQETANRTKAPEIINDPQDLANLRETCRLGREVLDLAGRLVKVGVTTESIDVAVHEACIARNCYPSPLNYHNFPKSCCTSVNEVICHGIPDARPLEDGDIVNIDITVYYKGFHGDLNETFLVGNVDPESKELVKTAYESMMAAVSEVKPGKYFRDFGKYIQKRAEKGGCLVTKTYCGHGIGRDFHSAPSVPHYFPNKAIHLCKPGMVFTIEPMINKGTWKDVMWKDDWTAVTKDGKRSAQFEHTLLVTEDGVEILTARTANSVKFWWEKKKKKRKKNKQSVEKIETGKANIQTSGKTGENVGDRTGAEVIDGKFGEEESQNNVVKGGGKDSVKKEGGMGSDGQEIVDSCIVNTEN